MGTELEEMVRVVGRSGRSPDYDDNAYMIRLITLMMMIVNYVEAGHRSGRRLIVRVQRPSLVVGWI